MTKRVSPQGTKLQLFEDGDGSIYSTIQAAKASDGLKTSQLKKKGIVQHRLIYLTEYFQS